MPRPVRLSPLGRRLAVAFLAVALTSLAAFAVLTVVIERRDVTTVARSQRAQATTAIVAAAENAYRANDGWSGARLQPLMGLADFTSSATELTAPDGTMILRTGAQQLFTTSSAVQETRPVYANGKLVGRLQLAFDGSGLIGEARRLRTVLAQTAGLSALVAVLVALAASVVLSRIAMRPLRHLSLAVRAIGNGDREVRIGPRAGPGELADLGQAFDSMVVALDHAERGRQALVAEVAHELRTPVAILQAETEALIDGVRQVTPDALASLHEEAVRLGQRIEDLQTLASADAAGLSLERNSVDLGDVAAHAADLLAGRFVTARVHLKRSLAPAPVWADAHRLHQVVTNLLANACKYTPSGGSVRLEVRPVDGCGELIVADSGPGVPADERAHIFDRFYRGSAGNDTAGSGIGLAVVDRIVRAHGGDIQLQSPPDGGACFVARLPAAHDQRPTGPLAVPTPASSGAGE